MKLYYKHDIRFYFTKIQFQAKIWRKHTAFVIHVSDVENKIT